MCLMEPQRKNILDREQDVTDQEEGAVVRLRESKQAKMASAVSE